MKVSNSTECIIKFRRSFKNTIQSILIVHDFFHSLEASPFVGQVKWLKYEWKWCIMATNSFYRCLKVQEAI